jgi:WD40 repeat protein
MRFRSYEGRHGSKLHTLYHNAVQYTKVMKSWEYLSGHVATPQDALQSTNFMRHHVKTLINLDSDQLIVSSNSNIFLYDYNIQSGSLIDGTTDETMPGDARRKGPSYEITAIFKLSKGRVASGFKSGLIRILNISSRTCTFTLEGHSSKIAALCEVDTNLMASVSESDPIYIWNIFRGTREKVLGNARGFTTLCKLPNAYLASGSWDGTISIWNLSAGVREKVFKGHSGSITSLLGSMGGILALCALLDGRLASGSWDHTICIWNVSDGTCQKVLKGHSDRVLSLCLLSDGWLASSSADKTIRIWNIVSGECENKLEGHTDEVTSLCVLTDGQLASCSCDDTLRIWNISNPTNEIILHSHPSAIELLFEISDGRLVSACENGTIIIWNVSVGEYDNILQGHCGSITALLELSNGCLVSASKDDTIRIWQVPLGQCKRTLTWQEDESSKSVTTLCELPDGCLVSGYLDGSIRIWDVSRGICKKVVESHSNSVSSLCPLANGDFVSGSWDGTICVWNSLKAKYMNVLKGHSDKVLCLCHVPSCGILASGSRDCSIHVWSVADGICKMMLNGHSDKVVSLCETCDDHLASGSEDKTIRIWNLMNGTCEKLLETWLVPATPLMIKSFVMGCFDDSRSTLLFGFESSFSTIFPHLGVFVHDRHVLFVTSHFVEISKKKIMVDKKRLCDQPHDEPFNIESVCNDCWRDNVVAPLSLCSLS